MTVVDNKIGIHFQGDEFRNVNILKTVRPGEKWSIMTLQRLIFQTNGMILNVILHGLGLHFQGQTFSLYAFVI